MLYREIWNFFGCITTNTDTPSHSESDKNVLIQVKDLKKAFGTNQVLDGITTDICQGEVVAVIGPSGSGKSTFLRSLNLLEVPTGGQILFEGTDITDPKVDINRHR